MAGKLIRIGHTLTRQEIRCLTQMGTQTLKQVVMSKLRLKFSRKETEHLIFVMRQRQTEIQNQAEHLGIIMKMGLPCKPLIAKFIVTSHTEVEYQSKRKASANK